MKNNILELTTQQMAAARLLLGDKKVNTLKKVAKEVGVTIRTVSRWVKDPRFIEYQQLNRQGMASAFVEQVEEQIREQAKEEAKAEMAKHDLPPLPDRARMLAKLWEFACIDPALTKHNTDSQRAALTEMWTKMGFDRFGPAPGLPGEPEKPKMFRAEWMQ